jgi:hypothetical protein
MATAAAVTIHQRLPGLAAVGFKARHFQPVRFVDDEQSSRITFTMLATRIARFRCS